MERAWLESKLAEGRSIESIATEVGKHPSTVGYWVKKHGLVSAHAERHAPRGGIPREVLERLVSGGHSSHEIARELGVSQTTVRHWLKQHGLQTRRAAQLGERGSAPPGDDGVITAECVRHGVTRFVPRGDSGFRCLACRSEAVVTRRRLVKATLVAEAGGRCLICGYDGSVAALQFHHLDRRRRSSTSLARE